MIEVAGVTKTFGSKTAVDDLSFEVGEGRVTGFLGPNGAGKSTTLRVMVGLLRPDSGRVQFDGRGYAAFQYPVREVGVLIDAGSVHPTRSARDHLRVIAASNRIDDSRVDEVLDLVGLREVGSHHVGTYSLGMRQRLGLGAALLGDPPILLLDEPVNGLDPEGISWMRNLLRTLADQGRSVFVSSHQLAELSQIVDDLVVIARGRLLAQATLAEFTAQHTTQEVSVVSPQAAQLAALLRERGATVDEDRTTLTVQGVEAKWVGELCAAHGIVLHHLDQSSGSLEQAFLDLTSQGSEYRGQNVAAADPSPFAPPPPGGAT
jgi:ABC-2 type transport system ATP-binding protein